MPTINTPLDSLKNAALRVNSTLEGVGDAIAGGLCDRDHEEDLNWMDCAKQAVWMALAEHVPGITWNGFMVEMTPDAFQQVHHYDDHSLIIERIQLGDGTVADYFPRLDGDRDTFLAIFKPRLRLVAASESVAAVNRVDYLASPFGRAEQESAGSQA